MTAAARSWIQQCAESHDGILDLFDSGAVGVLSARDFGSVDEDVALAANKSFEISKFKFKISESSNFRTF